MSTAPEALGPAAQAWKDLVEGRESLSTGARQPRYWDRRARSFAFAGGWGDRDRRDPFLEFLEPWLGPTKTVLDVGAGTGRQAGPLAERVEWVTAVEPSEGMRALIPPHDNMTVIASRWEDAEPQKADLVICSHVLYGVADVVPFLAKLEAHARERVFVYLRTAQTDRPVDVAWARWGPARPRMPEFGDLVAVLREMGVEPEQHLISYPVVIAYPEPEAAVEEVEQALGEHWPGDEGRALVESLLVKEDGAWLYRGREMTSGVAHWAPRS